MEPAVSIRCPTCGADDQNGAQCRRCRTDLRLLQRLEQACSRERSLLVGALADGRWDDALTSARYASHLLADETSRRQLAVCQLLAGHFEEACLTWQSATERPPAKDRH